MLVGAIYRDRILLQNAKKKKNIIQVKHLAGKSSILAMHARLNDRKCGNIFLLKNERIMNFKGLHTYM